MIRSMTGFGRASFDLGERNYEVEIRSVNHRHLDVRVRLPRPLSDHEPAVKSLAQACLQRGKVDINVAVPGAAAPPGELEVDREVAGQYVAAARALAEEHGVEGALDISTLVSMPGVTRFVETALDADEVGRALGGGVEAALTGLLEMRGTEGAALASELESRLQTIESLITFFEQRSEEVTQAATERLRKRTEQIRQETGMLDEARLHQEIVIAADRLDITEELVRLGSHVSQFRAIMAEGDGAIGRRLDFLLQEMGREANTIGSKANDAPLAHNVVELKTELERIREQVQNVE